MIELFRSRPVRGEVLAIILIVSPLHCGDVFARDAQSSTPNNRAHIAGHVSEASKRFGIPEQWIYAVMHIESRGRISALSPVGAMGLMQIMPATWASLRARYRLGKNAYDPRDNIHAGTAYLREMYDQFGVPGFLAAYNAGPGRYLDYVRKGRVLPLETRRYVAKIMPMIAGRMSRNRAVNVQSTDRALAKPAAVHWTQSGLFASQNEPTDRLSPSSTFAPRTSDNIVPTVEDNPLHNDLFADISVRAPR